MSIRQFWYGRDSAGSLACFVGGYTPQELGVLKSEEQLNALSTAIVAVFDYAETHSTKCEAIKNTLERTDLSVIERSLLSSQMKKQEEQCRFGFYVYDAFDRNLLFKKVLSPSAPLNVDVGVAKLWNAALVQLDVQFSAAETLNLDLRDESRVQVKHL